MQTIISLLLITSLICSLAILAIHIGFHPPRRVESGPPADCGMACRETIINTHGSKRLLAGWLPAAAPSPTAVLLHGSGANAELMCRWRSLYIALALLLTDHGRPAVSRSMSYKVTEGVSHQDDAIIAMLSSVGNVAVESTSRSPKRVERHRRWV